MIDINLCHKSPDLIIEKLKQRQENTEIIKTVIDLDNERRKVIEIIDQYRLKRNQLSRSLGKNKDNIETVKKEVKKIKEQLELKETEQYDCEKKLNDLLMKIPNLPDDSVPFGKSEADNIIVKKGESAKITESEYPHWELAKNSTFLDFERGVKLSGSRFYILRGSFAKLQRSLIDFLLDHLCEAGFEELALPYMVHQEALLAAGQLPKFIQNLYRDHEEDYWWVPTAEVPITGMHAKEFFEESDLPKLYAAHTPCFRREKASAGSDVRGIKRGHQFDKVEMFAYCLPKQSFEIFQKMQDCCIQALEKLELPYQVKELCTGDLGFAASKTYDIEVWAASCKEWLEVSSISICKDFQARRAKIKVKKDKEKYYCHTLNGSCFGIPRIMIALLENNLRENSIHVPQVLQSRMGTTSINLNL